jgi:hypothetical protein
MQVLASQTPYAQTHIQLWNQLKEDGYTAKLLNAAFYRSAKKLGLFPAWQMALPRAYEPASNEWQAFVPALKDIKSFSEELNLHPPVFAILNQGDPGKNGSEPDKAFKLYLQWFQQGEKAVADVGYISYNHEIEIANRKKNESLVINKLDGHPSANVNRIYGEKLYQVIAKELAKQQLQMGLE